jgi:hypothetical protein
MSEDKLAIIKLVLQHLYEFEYLPSACTASRSSEKPEHKDYAVLTQFPSHVSFYEKTWCAYKIRVCNNVDCSICYFDPIPAAAESLIIYTKLYEYADRYDIHGLKDLAQPPPDVWDGATITRCFIRLHSLRIHLNLTQPSV